MTTFLAFLFIVLALLAILGILAFPVEWAVDLFYPVTYKQCFGGLVLLAIVSQFFGRSGGKS